MTPAHTAAEALEEVPISDERLAELIADYQHFSDYQDPDDEDGRLVLSALRELQHRRAALSGQAEPVAEITGVYGSLNDICIVTWRKNQPIPPVGTLLYAPTPTSAEIDDRRGVS